jgi:hypothetical protein
MTPALLARLALGAATRPAARGSRRGGKRTTSRTALASFVVAAIVLNAAAMLALDDIRPGIRDPEYGRRIRQYRQRVAEHPGRPVVLVVGSSRAAMGVSPAAWEEIAPAGTPLIFNLSVLGGGPVMEHLIARRAFQDGVKPDVVLFEYWPPYLYSQGNWAEHRRIVVERLSPSDRPIVREHFPDPDRIEARMHVQRWNPLWAARERLLVQVFPKWLRNDRRMDWMWDEVDAWGWKPGFDYPPGPTPERARMLAACGEIYRPLFADYRISPSADRALRAAIGVAQQNGAKVGLLYLPESTEFRSWYSPRAAQLAREHLAAMTRDLGVPVINAREWMDDGLLVDGFHLSRRGAAEFTRMLGPAIAAEFPEVER